MRFRIGEDDPREFLALFSSVLDAASAMAAELNARFEVPPGALLVLRNRTPSSGDEFAASLRSPTSPARWPPYLAARWPALKGGVFWYAMEQTIDHAPGFGITDATEMCRVLAAVAQTLLTTDAAIRTRNETLARKYRRDPANQDTQTRRVTRPVPAPPPAPVIETLPIVETSPPIEMPLVVPAHPPVEPPPPVPPVAPPDRIGPGVDRPDERGVRLETDTLVLVPASHQGPRLAGPTCPDPGGVP